MQRLKQMLDAGNTVIGGWRFIPDPIYVGVVANQGFDPPARNRCDTSRKADNNQQT